MRMIALLAATAVVVSACGDDDDGDEATVTTVASAAAGTEADTDAGAAATGDGDADIVIVGFQFPEEIRVPAGEPVTVRNEDDAEHTVTAIDGAFNVTVGGGATATIEALEPGTYDFVCNFHGGMEGTLIVE